MESNRSCLSITFFLQAQAAHAYHSCGHCKELVVGRSSGAVVHGPLVLALPVLREIDALLPDVVVWYCRRARGLK